MNALHRPIHRVQGDRALGSGRHASSSLRKNKLCASAWLASALVGEQLDGPPRGRLRPSEWIRAAR